MSIEALEWALCTAPKHPTDSVRLVLLGLANHAWKDGTGAFPSQGTLASYLSGGDCRANRRKVQRALSELESGGWIRRGSVSKVAGIPKGQRPIVWDLDLTLVDSQPQTPVTHVGSPPSPVSPPPPSPMTVDPRHSQTTPPSLVTQTPVTGVGLTVRNRHKPLEQPPSPTSPPGSTGTATAPINIFSKEQINQCDQCDDRGRKLNAPPQLVARKAICHHRKEHTA